MSILNLTNGISQKAKIKIKLRKYLNADALFKRVYSGFEKIKDHRLGNTKISLPDALMSAFAMFSLKDPSLLAFDEKRLKDEENLEISLEEFLELYSKV